MAQRKLIRPLRPLRHPAAIPRDGQPARLWESNPARARKAHRAQAAQRAADEAAAAVARDLQQLPPAPAPAPGTFRWWCWPSAEGAAHAHHQ